MIEGRRQGLLTLHWLFIAIVLPVWFLIAVYIGVEYVHKIKYEQINFPIYLAGIAFASLQILSNYSRADSRRTPGYLWVEAIRKTNSNAIVLALAFFAIVYATKDKSMSRLFLGSFILSTWFILLPLNRYLPIWLTRLLYRGDNAVKTVLVGNPGAIKYLDEWITEEPPLGMQILGIITPPEKDEVKAQIPHLGTINEFERILVENKVQQVILLETLQSREFITSVIDTAQHEGCRILIVNDWEDYFKIPVTTVNEGQYSFYTLQEEPLENPINRFLKRFLDIAVSLPIVLTILPILCVIIKCIQIKQSPGPLIFRQKRSGVYKKAFYLYKFRTMHFTEKNTTDESHQATVNDERVYPLGKFLRKNSIDEFAQFLNVLLGEMSLVGPRPHYLKHDEEFRKEVNIYQIRHLVKPGITGLAQSRGFRGEITDVSQIHGRVRSDLEYINSWTIWMDILIILKTIYQVMFPPRSAY